MSWVCVCEPAVCVCVCVSEPGVCVCLCTWCVCVSVCLLCVCVCSSPSHSPDQWAWGLRAGLLDAKASQGYRWPCKGGRVCEHPP